MAHMGTIERIILDNAVEANPLLKPYSDVGLSDVSNIISCLNSELSTGTAVNLNKWSVSTKNLSLLPDDVLGLCRVNVDALLKADICHSVYVESVMTGSNHRKWSDAQTYIHRIQDLNYVCSEYGESELDVLAELLFWINRMASDKQDASVGVFGVAQRLDISVAELIKRHEELEKVVVIPQMQEYFAAGLSDIPTIERYIVEGIDPSLAIGLAKTL